MGYSINGLEEIAYEGGPSKKTLFNKGAISENDIPAKLLYHYSKKTGTRITWELSIKETTGSDWWNFQVDALPERYFTKKTGRYRVIFWEIIIRTITQITQN